MASTQESIWYIGSHISLSYQVISEDLNLWTCYIWNCRIKSQLLLAIFFWQQSLFWIELIFLCYFLHMFNIVHKHQYIVFWAYLIAIYVHPPPPTTICLLDQHKANSTPFGSYRNIDGENIFYWSIFHQLIGDQMHPLKHWFIDQKHLKPSSVWLLYTKFESLSDKQAEIFSTEVIVINRLEFKLTFGILIYQANPPSTFFRTSIIYSLLTIEWLMGKNILCGRNIYWLIDIITHLLRPFIYQEIDSFIFWLFLINTTLFK